MSEDFEMKIYEIIVESELDEANFNITVREAKRYLSAMGYAFSGRKTGSHEQWVKSGERTYPLPIHDKQLPGFAASSLIKLMKANNFDPASLEEDIDEAMGLPGDSSTLLSLLSEMANMLGAGGPQHDQGPLRSAIMQVFNNGSAADAEGFEKQLNFRLGSVRSMWMSKNWPQLKSCFLRLKKNPKYQRSITALDALGDWPVFLIKDKENPPPTLSKYFNTILISSPPILKDMGRFDPEGHVRDRAMHLASLIPERMSAFNEFKRHWTAEYDKESSTPVSKTASDPNAGLKGQQAAAGQSIVDQVLNAIPKDLAKQLRPQVQRMGSQNEKMMFLMKELQKAGIDPNKVLG